MPHEPISLRVRRSTADVVSPTDTAQMLQAKRDLSTSRVRLHQCRQLINWVFGDPDVSDDILQSFDPNSDHVHSLTPTTLSPLSRGPWNLAVAWALYGNEGRANSSISSRLSRLGKEQRSSARRTAESAARAAATPCLPLRRLSRRSTSVPTSESTRPARAGPTSAAAHADTHGAVSHNRRRASIRIADRNAVSPRPTGSATNTASPAPTRSSPRISATTAAQQDVLDSSTMPRRRTTTAPSNAGSIPVRSESRPF